MFGRGKKKAGHEVRRKKSVSISTLRPRGDEADESCGQSEPSGDGRRQAALTCHECHVRQIIGVVAAREYCRKAGDDEQEAKGQSEGVHVAPAMAKKPTIPST